MSDDLAAWLRPQIEARLTLAREACHGTDGHWWRRATDLGDGGPPEPVGPLYSGEPDIGTDGEVFGGEHIVVYDEGAPSGWQFDHIAANDPRDTIARCEADLAILDLHCGEWLDEDLDDGDYRSRQVCTRCDDGYWPCRTVRLLGKGYRHRGGYRQEWALLPGLDQVGNCDDQRDGHGTGHDDQPRNVGAGHTVNSSSSWAQAFAGSSAPSSCSTSHDAPPSTSTSRPVSHMPGRGSWPSSTAIRSRS
jgi:Family of unknown function (DUF6221)